MEKEQRARQRHLPFWLAIHSAGFCSSCPLTELAIKLLTNRFHVAVRLFSNRKRDTRALR